MYADDNEGRLAGGYVPNASQTDRWRMHQWVYPPFDSTMYQNGLGTRSYNSSGWHETTSKQVPTLQDRITGLKLGVLWKYTQTHEVYHCPGDKRMVKGTKSGIGDYGYLYRSYSLPDGLAGRNVAPYHPEALDKMTEVKRGAESFMFVEVEFHGAASFVYNHGGWSFKPWDFRLCPLVGSHGNLSQQGCHLQFLRRSCRAA